MKRAVLRGDIVFTACNYKISNMVNLKQVQRGKIQESSDPEKWISSFRWLVCPTIELVIMLLQVVVYTLVYTFLPIPKPRSRICTYQVYWI